MTWWTSTCSTTSGTTTTVIVEQLAALLVEPVRDRATPTGWSSSLAIAVEMADALIKMAFRRSPDGDPVVLGEAKALIRDYLHHRL